MDGTISPRPITFQEKSIPKKNQALLSRLVPKLALVAVISGRETEKVKDMVNVEGIKYVGHYGMEYWENGRGVVADIVQPYITSVRAVAKKVELLRNIPDIIIQDKWLTISIHYHLCENPGEVRQRILNLLAAVPEMKRLRIIEEKANVGVIPPVNIDKGTAVQYLIKTNNLKSAIFIGDDTADVPGFKIIHELQSDSFSGLAILVTGSETPPDIVRGADFTLEGIQETTELLKWLVANT